MKHARTAVVAALGAGVALGDTFTVQPLGGPAEPVYLSSAGTQGVRPQESFWSFPDVYTPAPDRAGVLRVSPDGQWALGNDAVAGLAARFSRTGATDIFQVSSNVMLNEPVSPLFTSNFFASFVRGVPVNSSYNSYGSRSAISGDPDCPLKS